MRGEGDCRNKEPKAELQADRLGRRWFLANFFGNYLHATASNPLAGLRHAVAQPH
jgi:hypothetical protein